MTASMADAEIRRRLAARFSPHAIRLNRVLATLMVVLWGGGTTADLATGGRGRVMWPALGLLLATVALVGAFRQRPRSVAGLTEGEVARARQYVRGCARCGEALLFESRCPKCASTRHALRLGHWGIDQWIPITAILVLLFLIFLAASCGSVA